MEARTSTVAPYKKVMGHAIIDHGGAHDDDGNRIIESAERDNNRRSYGRGKCLCGSLGPWVWGNQARKNWYRGHKKRILGRTVYQKQCSRCKETKTVNKEDKTQSDFYIFNTREEVDLRISSHCRACDQARVKRHEEGRKFVEKSVLISAGIHKRLKSMAQTKETSLSAMTNKAVRFYLENACPGKHCTELSRGGYLCDRCREKMYDTTAS